MAVNAKDPVKSRGDIGTIKEHCEHQRSTSVEYPPNKCKKRNIAKAKVDMFKKQLVKFLQEVLD